MRVVVTFAFAVPLVVAFHAATPSTEARSTRPSADRSLTLVKANVKPRAALYAVGTRYAGSPIPIRGYTAGVSAGKHRLVLQRYTSTDRRWVVRATRYVRTGAYAFANQTWATPGWVKYRTVLFNGRTRLKISNVITVRLLPAAPAPAPTCANAPSPTTCPKPAAFTELRTVDQPFCQQLTVATHQEKRTVDWRWDTTKKKWVTSPSSWATVPGSQGQRAAGTADCVKVLPGMPAGAALPDLRIKDLTKCGLGDSQATGGTCFKIDPSAPFNPDFPSLQGKKLLKFGVITMNTGAGPAEIIADRSGTDATAWRAYQTIYNSSGTRLGSLVASGVQFYFAGDGHNHWHVRDFDNYNLLDASGHEVARAEKHGYCMQDNTSYGPLQGQPGIPNDPVYLESTSCGKGLPNALTIIHGLSRGWGDTYPTTLPDQAIDITGVQDGTYTVQVKADAVGAVRESNENNNTASVKIQISGNTVTVVPGTATGLP